MRIRPYPLPKFSWHKTNGMITTPPLYPRDAYAAALPRLFDEGATRKVDDPAFNNVRASLDLSLQFVDAFGDARTLQQVGGDGNLYTPKVIFHKGYFRAALDILQGVLRIGEDNERSEEAAFQSDGNMNDEAYDEPTSQPTLYVPKLDPFGKMMNIWRPIESFKKEYDIPSSAFNSAVEDYLIRMLVNQPRLDGNDLTVHSGVRVGQRVWLRNPLTGRYEAQTDKTLADKAWKTAEDPYYLDENGQIPESITSEALDHLAWLTSDDPEKLSYDSANLRNLLRTFRGNLLVGTEQKNGSLWIGNGGNGKSLLLSFLYKGFGRQLVTNLDADALKYKGFERSNAVSNLATALFAIDDDADQDTKLDVPVLKSLTTGGMLHGRTIGNNGANFFSKAYAIVASNYIPTDQDANQVKRRWCYVLFKRKEADFANSTIVNFLQRYGIFPFLWLSLEQAINDPNSDLTPMDLSNWGLLTDEEQKIIDAIMTSDQHEYIKQKGEKLTQGVPSKLGLERKRKRVGDDLTYAYMPDPESDKWPYYEKTWKEHQLYLED